MKHVTVCLLLMIVLATSCKKDNAQHEGDLRLQIFHKCEQILRDHNQRVWNLDLVDTSDVKIYKGFFLKVNDSSLFISIKGEAGLSSGNANRLNLIAHYNDSLVVDYYEQGVLPDTILDFNNDGILDFFFTVSSVWMGSCNDSYVIKSFANSNEHELFFRRDESILNCGGIMAEISKFGDTLLTASQFDFIRMDNNIKVIVVTDYTIRRGGRTEQDILDSLYITKTIDTVAVKGLGIR